MQNGRRVEEEVKFFLNIDRTNGLRAAYLYGSSVYKTSTNKSDWDVLVVVDDFFTSNYVKHCEENSVKVLTKVMFDRDMTVAFTSLVDKQDYEVHVVDTQIFLKSVLRHKAVMTTLLWIPEEFVVYEDERMNLFKQWFLATNIQLSKIRTSFVREAEIWCYAKAKRLYAEGDVPKALKNLVHGIRYLMFAHQIIDHGSIIDFCAANNVYYELMGRNYDNIDDYLNEYRPLYDDLIQSLSHKLQAITGQHDDISLLDFLNTYGYSQLGRLYPVNIFELGGDLKGLVRICLDKESVRPDELLPLLLRNCNGSVVKRDKNEEYQYVCIGMNIEINHEILVNFDLDETFTVDVVYETSIGVECTLFYWCEKWHVIIGDRLTNTSFDDALQQISLTKQPSDQEIQFWNRFHKIGYKLPDVQHARKCFTFILAQYDSELKLHSVRDLDSLADELLEDYSTAYGWQIPNRHHSPISGSRQQVIEQLICQSMSLDLNIRGLACRDVSIKDFILDISQPVFLHMGKCKTWDLNIADNNNPLQSVDSHHNTECCVDTVRAYRREQYLQLQSIISHYFPLYLQLFNDIANDYWNMCDLVNDFYMNNCLDEVLPQNMKKLLAKFPLNQTAVLFLMKQKNVRTIEPILQTVFVKPKSKVSKQRSQKPSDLAGKIKPLIETRVVLQMIKQFRTIGT